MRWTVFTNHFAVLHSASSRLRAWYPLHHSSFADRHRVTFNPTQLDPNDLDVLYIQKCFLPQVAEVARHCFALGKTIIFDLDDPPEIVTGTDNSRELYTLLSTATHVTTDTPERSELLMRQYNLHRPPTVIPDCIDVADEALIADRLTRQPTPPFRAMWFGKTITFPLVADAFARLSQQDGIDLTIIGPADLGHQLHQQNLPYHFLPWSLDIWTQHRGQFDAAILSHLGDETDQTKSDNKMVTALANGVLPIVSRTPAYTRLAHLTGLQDRLFTTLDDLVDIVTRERNHALPPPRPDIAHTLRAHYSRDHTARLFESLALN